MSTKMNSSTTYLQSCVDIIQMTIQRKMFQTSKDEIGLVLFGTTNTDNEMHEESEAGDYSHVSVTHTLSMVDWSLLEYAQNEIHATQLDANAMDGLCVAINHFDENINAKKMFNQRRIILLTDYSSALNDSKKLKFIKSKLADSFIQLNVVSPFSDEDHQDQDSESEEAKQPQEASNRPTGSNGSPG